MSGPQTSQRLTSRMLDEHRQIHFYLDQIAESLEGLKEGLSDAEPMRRLAAQLQGFRERLNEHNQAEEGHGLFQAMLDALPTERAEIDRLADEHPRMIEILEMARLHALRGDPSEADALRVDLQDFLNTFREHERREEELLSLAIEKHDSIVP